MSKFLKALKAQANAHASTAEDMREGVEGSTNPELYTFPEGQVFLRIVEYVELGTQTRKTKNEQGVEEIKPVPNAFRVGFAVFSPSGKNAEAYQFEDGTPKIMRTYVQMTSRSTNSNAYKWFRAWNYTGEASTMAQLIGNVYIGKAVKEKGRMRIDFAAITPAMDPRTGELYDVPEVPDSVYKFFIWDDATKEMWDTLYFETKEGRKESFYQKDILKARNFEGSPVQAMLSGEDISIEEDEKPSKHTKNVHDDDEEEDAVPVVKKAPQRKASTLPSTGKVKIALPDDDDDEE